MSRLPGEETFEQWAALLRDPAQQPKAADGYELRLESGSRLGLRASRVLNGWFVGYSPRNGDDGQVEGEWADWVTLAKQILEIDAKVKK